MNCYLLAEIGFNHGGDIDLAMKMITSAKTCGADGVKFQSFRADDLYFEGSAEYEIFRAGEISEQDHIKLKKQADDVGIDFISTPFSATWAFFLKNLGANRLKVASMDLNNHLLLEAVAQTGLGIIYSTGGGTVDETKNALSTLKKGGATDITALHCISNYPTTATQADLQMISRFKNELGVDIGFSDHTQGITIPTCAVALGAGMIEKHFTIDKSLPGPDNAISADPKEMSALRKSIDLACLAVRKTENERADIKKKPAMRRGLYARSHIKKGEKITIDKIVLLRPEVVPLEKLGEILDSEAMRNYTPKEPLVAL